MDRLRQTDCCQVRCQALAFRAVTHDQKSRFRMAPVQPRECFDQDRKSVPRLQRADKTDGEGPGRPWQRRRQPRRKSIRTDPVRDHLDFVSRARKLCHVSGDLF